MGQRIVYQMPLEKRHDYSTEEIEKKYSTQELTQLVLLDSIFNYPPKRYFPNKKCLRCRKNPITKEFQLSENRECLDCYSFIKKENYDYIMKCISEEKFFFEGNCILENKLYLGDIKSSFMKDTLKKLGITHILMVGYFMTPLFPDDFKYENIEINDNGNENILKHLVKGIKFIEESHICYTHCQLGKSRSASIVIAYIMYKNKMHFSEAFDFVRDKRNAAFPNEGFQWQLEDFDIILYNYDYDSDKCDEFIQKFFENRENLEKSEKSFIKENRNKKSNTDREYDVESLDDIFDDENEDKNKEEEIESKKNEIEMKDEGEKKEIEEIKDSREMKEKGEKKDEEEKKDIREIKDVDEIKNEEGKKNNTNEIGGIENDKKGKKEELDEKDKDKLEEKNKKFLITKDI